MVLEHAVLDVRPGREAEFEAAFAEAKAVIAAAPGFVGLRLERRLEAPGRYLLLVEWRTLEDHTEGFRGSDAYQEWRRMLHHFYDPFPTVEHFTTVAEVSAGQPGS